MKNKKQLQQLGDAIRLERLKQKMSQDKLAALAKLSQYQHISKIERAEIEMRVTTLFSILKALNVKLEDLIDLYEQK